MEMPNFHSLDFSDHEVDMLEDAFKAISSTSSWEFLKTFEPKEGEGFLLTSSLQTANQQFLTKEEAFKAVGQKTLLVQKQAEEMLDKVYIAMTPINPEEEKTYTEEETREIINMANTAKEMATTMGLELGEVHKAYVEAKEQFETAKKLDAIMNAMQIGHSGSSYAWVMRQMEALAKQGWDVYSASVGPKKKNAPIYRPCHCRAAQGYESGWCGVASWGVPGCEY
jgi:hypothetical protein